MLHAAAIGKFSRIVSQSFFDRFGCIAFVLLYFAAMGALVVVALCPETIRRAFLAFVAMPSALLSAGLILALRSMRIEEAPTAKATHATVLPQDDAAMLACLNIQSLHRKCRPADDGLLTNCDDRLSTQQR